ncbi:MAG: class I SAM-dependent methyltransferase, partial [Candidatus Omnitrophota bacterium]
ANDKFFESKIKCSFIEPNPERLLSLLRDEDTKRHNIVKKYVQEIDISFFKELVENDILFIDSSHISKIGSDVNHIFFNILPNLNKGVVVHFHDIFYPFEYPKKWVFDGITFNESYILKAFLQFNKEFKIILFNSFLDYHFNEKSGKEASDEKCEWLRDGSSIWIRKLG